MLALDVVEGCVCCDGHGDFDLQSYFPGKLYNPISASSSRPSAKRKRTNANQYRQPWQCVPLARSIEVWLRSAAATLKGYPRYFILSDGDITRLVKTHPNKLQTQGDLLLVLGRLSNAEWKTRFAGGLLALLDAFPAEAKHNRKVWEEEHKAEVKRKKEQSKAKKTQTKAKRDVRVAVVTADETRDGGLKNGEEVGDGDGLGGEGDGNAGETNRNGEEDSEEEVDGEEGIEDDEVEFDEEEDGSLQKRQRQEIEHV